MRWRLGICGLLIAAVVLAGFAASGGAPGGVRAQETAATPVGNGICGVDQYLVAAGTPAAGTPVPVGLYRSVNQVLGPMSYVEFNGTPTLNEHLTGIGVFCLEAGGTIPEGDYNQSIILLSIPASPEDVSLRFDLIGPIADGDPATDDGWVEICRSADGMVCDASAATPITSGDGDFDLNDGEMVRLINMQFTVSNPGDSDVIFSVMSLSPGSGGCPTKCWISP